ncbi:PucR family transcriptional regulator [Streptomyces daliensis]|uniref:Helix-turn-helix domain-containing protein n=1 Tax=Streptomyces daliensis TaxID=299421 RepID=A0A8T4IXP9_9ACTN|nr:helix-turn-helix domain-containing protein [Streptomyces daliensis]
MCDLLNRIWSRPRGEWTRVLRKELPTIADQVVEALQHSIPAMSALLREIEREDAQWAVEQALLTALGYQHQEIRDMAAEAAAVPSGPVAPAVPIDRARRHLFATLVGETREYDGAEIPLTELSRSARWPLPDTVRAIALTSPCEDPQLAAALGNALVSPVDGELCLLVPDPHEDAAGTLENLLRGRTAAVGHIVPLGDAASSVRWARRLLEIAPTDVGAERGVERGAEHRVLFVDDHLSMLLLLQDESLTRALSARWLEPLSELTPRQSERLEVTLLAWLESGGAPEAAKTLQVHPQTVRYRLRQIEKLFGPALRDPRTRFELEMTLRGRRMLSQVRRRRLRAGRRARTVTAGAGIRPLGVAREARVNGL